MKNLLAALAVLAAVPAHAQNTAPATRYVFVVAPQGDGKGSHAVFKLDTVTGRVYYCTPRTTPEGGTIPMVVQCVTEPK